MVGRSTLGTGNPVIALRTVPVTHPVRAQLQAATALSVTLIALAQGLSAQAIPREEYLRYMPLEYVRLTEQTRASAALFLYGDRSSPTYRDVAPVDGVDDARHAVLHELGVRFAPYLVRNTIDRPMDFKKFMEISRAFNLYVHTWDINGATKQLVREQTVDFVALRSSPCTATDPATAPGQDDCLLLQLLEEFHPDGPAYTAGAISEDPDLFKVLYFDFPGDGPASWRAEYENVISGALNRRYEDFAKIYAHPFIREVRSNLGGTAGYEFVLQYWFFYPTNDGGNNHEGDWEHINVMLSPRSKVTGLLTANEIQTILKAPNDATDPLVIKRLDSYFHSKVMVLDYASPNVYLPRPEWEAQVNSMVEHRQGERWIARRIRQLAYRDQDETIININPIVYIGADNKGPDQLLAAPGGSNRDSHGTFPMAGTYKGVGAGGASEHIGNYFSHRNYFSDTTRGLPEKVERFDLPERIELVPDWERVIDLARTNADVRAEWGWMLLPIRWGYPASVSPFAGVVSHAETGNLAPPGPNYNKGWNRTGANAGFGLYEPHRFVSVFPLGIEDSFENKLGFLNLLVAPFFLLPPFDLGWRVLGAPVRAITGKNKPLFYAAADIPFRFLGLGIGETAVSMNGDFALLHFNDFQIADIQQALADAGLSTGIGTVSVGGTDAETVAAPIYTVYLFLGKRLVTVNRLRHSRSDVSLTILSPSLSGGVGSIVVNSTLNMWEYTGSFRYNLKTGGFQPFIKLGYGLSWYRLEKTEANGEPLASPNSPWVRQPQLKGLKNLFPNTWHGGLGVEWLPIRSSAPIPRGIDIGLEAEFTLFTHGLGLSDVTGLEGPLQLTDVTIWRPATSIGLVIGF